jgi:hypothetical protein
MRLRDTTGSVQTAFLLTASFVATAWTACAALRGTSGLVLKSVVLYLTWSRG